MKMSYFELFELQSAICIDKKQLTKAYMSLSRVLHPDRFATATQAEQDEALKRYTAINDGYRILKDDNLRYKYLLELADIMPAEGEAKVPQGFLMDMMDLNEQLMELQFDPNLEASNKVNDQLNQLEADLDTTYTAVLSQDNPPSEAELKKLLDYYLKRRYVMRIRSKLNTFDAL